MHRDLINTDANTRLVTGVSYLIAGVPSNEWQDHGTDFGLFPILPHNLRRDADNLH